MSGCEDGCGAKAVKAATTPAYVRTLWLVVFLNAGMFLIGLGITVTGGSVSVRADLLDFLGDALATGIGLLLVGRSRRVRSLASLWQGFALGVLGLFVLGTAFSRISGGVAPEPFGMSVYGVLGLCVNIGAALLLLKHRNGDASVRAIWLYSRNDAIGNLIVLAAAALVVVSGSYWPDLIAGAAIAFLFLHSSLQIIRDSRRELREVVE